MTDIIIDGRKETTFDFGVTIEGIAENSANVRIVIENKVGYEFSINCKKLKENNKWRAIIPPLHNLEKYNKYRLEVIAENYYFCPANGNVIVNVSPVVSVESFVSKSKPTVSTTMSVNTVVVPKPLKEFHNISDTNKSVLISKCETSSVVFGKISKLFSMMNEKKNIDTKSLFKIIENVKKHLSSIEDIIT